MPSDSAKTPRCPDCDGTQHILVSPGVYKTCHCQKESLHKGIYLRAGLPEHLWDQYWPDLDVSQDLLKYVKGVRSGTQTKPFIALAKGSVADRHEVAALFLRDLVGLGRSICHVDFIEVVSLLGTSMSFSQEERKEGGHILNVDALWVRMEVFVPHGWNQMALSRLLQARRFRGKKITLITAESIHSLTRFFSDIHPLDDPDLCLTVRL